MTGSILPWLRSALSVPTASASGVAMIVVPAARMAVFSMPVETIWETGSCDMSDVPHRPVTSPPNQCQYWSAGGSSRCICARNAATDSGVA